MFKAIKGFFGSRIGQTLAFGGAGLAVASVTSLFSKRRSGFFDRVAPAALLAVGIAAYPDHPTRQDNMVWGLGATGFLAEKLSFRPAMHTDSTPGEAVNWLGEKVGAESPVHTVREAATKLADKFDGAPDHGKLQMPPSRDPRIPPRPLRQSFPVAASPAPTWNGSALPQSQEIEGGWCGKDDGTGHAIPGTEIPCNSIPAPR